MSQSSQIVDFFSGKVVFLTGCTGFVGKLIMERLLRVCQVQLIYILVRPKKGKPADERFNEMFNDPPIEKLKKEQLDFAERVKMINGDLRLDNLGVSEENWRLLHDTVQIIIHCAATVRFDQHLRTAYKINIRSTEDLILHARKMTNMESFLHISTAFSNCPRSEILEQLYEPPINAKQLERVLEALDDDEIVTRLTPPLLGDWPNTYSFTKCIAEDLVYKMASEEGLGISPVPLSILRPSIIVSTYKEPIPGWIDNFYGPIGFIIAAGTGFLRSMMAFGLAEVVPVDYVVNAALATCWATATRWKNNNKAIEVYNYTCDEHSITWQNLLEKCMKVAYDEGLSSIRSIWKSSLSLHKHKWLFIIHSFFVHTIPAHIVDFLCWMLGKPQLLVESYKKLNRFLEVMCYFATRKWSFPHDKILKLWDTLNDKDQALFELRISTLDWNLYIPILLRGARIYLLREPMDNIPEARKRQFKFQVADWILRTILCLGMAYFCYWVFSCFV